MFGDLFMWAVVIFFTLFIVLPVLFRAGALLVWMGMGCAVLIFAVVSLAWDKVDHFWHGRTESSGPH